MSLPARPCALLMAVVCFGRSCQAELSARLAPERAGEGAPDTREQRGTGESRRPGERPGEQQLQLQRGSPKQTPCLAFLAERMKSDSWEWLSSQTLRVSLILAQEKHLKLSGLWSLTCRVSQQVLVLSKWEVLGSGRCLWLKMQSCSTAPVTALLREPVAAARVCYHSVHWSRV